MCVCVVLERRNKRYCFQVIPQNFRGGMQLSHDMCQPPLKFGKLSGEGAFCSLLCLSK